ncbi:MAG: adenosylmethionine--8-amino-7-oxononanoate transaminase [Succiniclasticum sp.]|nr:adenosylmethionine--8-amino-7-oxononanoate transaminase [Succiniclasticum sp.]
MTLNKWEELDKKYIWHPFTQMKGWLEAPQLVIDHGEGVRLYDTEGREYLDAISSLWVNIHGHRRKEINDAIIAELNKVEHSTLLGLINEPSAELAEKLVEVTPAGLNKVFYSDDGSTAVEAAIKIAFQYWNYAGHPEKKDFINLGDSYHGDTVGAVSVGNVEVFHKAYKPLLFGTHRVTCPSFYHSKLGLSSEKEFLAYLLTELEDYLQEHASHTAAMIIEPLCQCAAGMLMQPEGYIKGVRELTKKYNVLLIVDEVAVGFGRTGAMYACDREQVLPDMMCLSKGISAGYLPLGATMVTDEIYNAFLGEPTEYKTFYHGHSYTGNNLACAAGLASLKIFAKDQVITGLPPKIAMLQQHFAKMGEMEFVGDARQCGMLGGIELMADKAKKIPFNARLQMAGGICQNARKYGLIIRNIGDVIVVMPPLVSTPAEIDEMMSRLEKSMEEIFNRVRAKDIKEFSDPCAF